jgi:Rieske Fe-S protein
LTDQRQHPDAAVAPAVEGGAAPHRRRFLTVSSTAVMAGGLAAGYGTFGYLAGAYLYSDDDGHHGWQFVARANDVQAGKAVTYVSPAGDKVVVARQSEGATADDFIALSSVCPHLGCQVHWEAHRDRFFCPCHNGVFDPQGRPLEGPPAAANQPLTRFPLRVERGLLYVLVPLKSVVASRDGGHGAGGLA